MNGNLPDVRESPPSGPNPTGKPAPKPAARPGKAPRKPRWTTFRRFLGNVLPLVLSVPFLVLAVQRAAEFGPDPLVWRYGAFFLAIGWGMTAFLGYLGNGSLQENLAVQRHAIAPFEKRPRWFVGVATPGFKSALDPHEDVAFLVLHEDKLEIFGERVRLYIPRAQIRVMRLRPNIHSWLFLGGWISIEGERDGQPFRILVEPRMSPAVLLNALARRRLLGEWSAWWKRGLAPTPTPEQTENRPEPETDSERS